MTGRGDIADVDLDSDETRLLADEFLNTNWCRVW